MKWSCVAFDCSEVTNVQIEVGILTICLRKSQDKPRRNPKFCIIQVHESAIVGYNAIVLILHSTFQSDPMREGFVDVNIELIRGRFTNQTS